MKHMLEYLTQFHIFLQLSRSSGVEVRSDNEDLYYRMPHFACYNQYKRWRNALKPEYELL